MRKPKGYWNYDTCYAEAKKYSSRNGFKHGNETAYRISREKGWIEDYDWLIPQLNLLTYEECYKLAKRCTTKADLKRLNIKAYKASFNKGWIKKFDWLLDGRFFDSDGVKKDKSKKEPNFVLESKQKTHNIYAYEFEGKAVYVGLTATRRIKGRIKEHFLSNSPVSKYASENNVSIPEMRILFTDLTPLEASIKEGEVLSEYANNGWTIVNKAPTGSLGSYLHGYWTKERCIEESKKYKTIKEYQNCNQSSYYAARINEWLDEFTWLERSIRPSKYWDHEHCLEEAKKYQLLNDFKTNSQRAYIVATKNGWIREYTWLKRQLSPKGYWDDYNNCYQTAKQYDSRISFCHGNGPAYQSAREHKWLDDYTWFKYKKQKPKGYWTYETCYEEARKYKTRTEFSKNCNRGYLMSLTKGWINDYIWFKNNNTNDQFYIEWLEE